MIILFILLLSLLSTVFSLPVTFWPHQLNTPFCNGTGPGVCNFGWEWFYDKSAQQNSYHAWVYDRYCTNIADSQYGVPGYNPSYPGKGLNDYMNVLFHIDCSPNLPYNVIMTNALVWEDKEWPVFYYAGKKYGGTKCSCGSTALDPNGVWACQCAFDC